MSIENRPTPERVDLRKVLATQEALQNFFDHLKTNEGQLNPGEMAALAKKFSPEVIEYFKRFLNDFEQAKK